jgi:hypothetical protein
MNGGSELKTAEKLPVSYLILWRCQRRKVLSEAARPTNNVADINNGVGKFDNREDTKWN